MNKLDRLLKLGIINKYYDEVKVEYIKLRYLPRSGSYFSIYCNNNEVYRRVPGYRWSRKRKEIL